MDEKILADGLIHEIPEDLKKSLSNIPSVCQIWNNLTPIARNEWICWIISPKKLQTRKNHIERICKELAEGKRRPCCWPGCAHR